MLTDLFFALAALALFHFVYESIVLPHLQETISIRYYVLRDRVRRLGYEQPALCPANVFLLLQESLNTSVLVTPRQTIGMVYQVRRLLKLDPDLRRQVENRRAILDAHPAPVIKEIRHEQFALCVKSIFANNFGLGFYILPLYLLLYHVTQTGITREERIFKHVHDVVDMPEMAVKQQVLPRFDISAPFPV